MRIVFDANIFISAFLVPGSQGEAALRLARRRIVHLYTSVAILTETAQTLTEKLDQLDENVRAALRIIARAATVVKPKTRVTILADGPDNRIFECAVEALADAVVTGDQHLLKLRTFEGIPILRLADFLRMFPKEDA